MSKEFNYEKWVKKCYDKELNQEIDNANREHALFLFESLLDKASRDGEDVKIISHQLFASFYKKLITKVQKIIDNGNKVEIIVESDIENGDDNIFYSKFKKIILKASSSFDELPNFIVVGDNAYRYETNKDSIKAIANFNDPEMGKFISRLFTNIKVKIT
jgi:sugar-specific transcriptional regulator TrmB